MLHPLLVDFLLEKYAGNHCAILDPFCGSGVTLLQGMMHGHDVIGFDINPIALLIAKAKTSFYDDVNLLSEFDDLKKAITKKGASDVPSIKNIDTWYAPWIVNDLGRIRHVLKSRPYLYSDFFTACFAFVCRNQSFTRNGEFKRYRMPEVKRECMKNEVFPLFFFHTEQMMKVFLRTNLPQRATKVMLQDVESGVPGNVKVDMILTSPPYGDSGTTVAYEQYTSFGFEWTRDLNSNFEAAHDYYKDSLGSKNSLFGEVNKHEVLMKTVKRVNDIDPKRAMDVLRFFNSYYRALANISMCLNDDGYMCLVVGNRTVKNQQIPMDQITASFMTGLGLVFDSISVREISNKVMPLKNSPSNVTGSKSKTMSMEYIVVCRKN